MMAVKRCWYSSLLIGMLLISARDVGAVALDISGIVFEDANVNGRLDADERALPEVFLSDGVQVVQVDRWGRYQLTTESSRVLCVSLPGDYLANGDFFERLAGHHNGDIIDFALVKHRWRDDFSFLFFTDSHVTSTDKFNATAGMKTAVAHMNQQRAELAISGGDVIMDALRACEPEARAQYELYQELASALKMPLFNAIGNHELFGIYLEGVGDDPCVVEEDDPLYGAGLFREYLGPDYYSFNWGPYHFVVLNTIGIAKIVNTEGDTVRTYYGTVSTDQIQWLQKDLARVSTEQPIILVGHIPFITAAHTLEGYSNYQVINYDLEDAEAKSYTHVVSNGSEVINEILADHRVILALAGHHHHYEAIRWADNEHDATFVIGGSICGQWWAGDRHFAGSSWPEGYVLVSLKDGQVEEISYLSYDWKGYQE